MKKITLLSLGLMSASLYSQAQSTQRIEADNGKVIGMAASGGSRGYGVTFKFTPSTQADTVCTQAVVLSGRSIYGAPKGSTLLHASNGLLYGLTQFGGLFGLGGLYSYDPTTAKDSLLVSFNWINGDDPQGPLMQASNGLLYGLTLYGGNNGAGVLFSYDPITGKDTVWVNFADTNGQTPYYGRLVQAPNGKLYGMTAFGGTGKGVLFSYDPVSNIDSVRVNFNGTSTGSTPYGGLVLGSDNRLYGMTTFGGAHDSGLIFRYNPVTHQDTILFNFTGKSGGMPYGSLMQAGNGLLYGMTNLGGTSNMGTLFCYDPVKYRDSVLINFNGTNGRQPNGDNTLIQASNGLLYGMTVAGGDATYPFGVLFYYNPTNGYDSIIENFTNGLGGGVSGELPFDGLVQDPATKILYGVTQWGGTYSHGGTLFSYTINTKSFSTLISLGGLSSNNGYITQAKNGIIYGTTSYGGTYSLGTLFSFDVDNNVSNVLHSFNFNDGAAPYGKLVQATDGNLYGTTSHGDTNNINDYGTIFRYNPTSNVLNTVLNFSVDPGGGQEPHSGLIQATNGLLYGVTTRSSGKGFGVLYSFNPAAPHSNNVLVTFNDTNGANPFWGLTQAKNSLIYGMTVLGGTSNKGVLYYYNPNTNKDSVMVNFNGTLGAYPFGGLIQSSVNHDLYGMTASGGTHNDGVIFRFNTATHNDTVVLNFNNTNGAHPISSLIQDSTGLLYGTTRYGGKNNYGVLFSFNPATNKDSVLLTFATDSGAYPTNIIILNILPTSINNVQEPKDVILVYPNPFSDFATVVFGNQGTHYVELDDMNGKQLRYLECTTAQTTIPRNNLATGIYVVKVYDNNRRFLSSSKIAVQ